MRQKFYRSEIIERFMPSDEQARFDAAYEQVKVRDMGREVVKLTLLGDDQKKSINHLIDKTLEALTYDKTR